MTITATQLTHGHDTSGAVSRNTASISPSANKLILLSFSARDPSAQPPDPTITGNGLTWVQVAKVNEDIGSGSYKLWIYRAMGASPSTGAITIDLVNGGFFATQMSWEVVEFGNVDTSGTNGSGAIVQVGSQSGADPTIAQIDMAAAASSNNAWYGVIAIVNSSRSCTADFTEIQSRECTGAGTPCQQTQWKVSATGTTITWTGGPFAQPWIMGKGVEIKAQADDSVSLGTATETDTAFALGTDGNVVLGTATETDTAFSLVAADIISLGTATETDSAFSLTTGDTVALGTALETDTAFGLGISDLDAPLIFQRSKDTLGCGEYRVYITRRGGGQVLLEVDFTTLNIGRLLNNAGQASVSVPVASPSAAACCEVMNTVEPWRDELLIYRDRDIAFVGPITSLEGSRDGGSINAKDLFQWTERRFLDEDIHLWEDFSLTFKKLFEKAMEPDPSPNVSIVTHQTGAQGIRHYLGKDFHRFADLLRELTRTALDFTVIGRTVYAGGVEVFSPENAPGQTLMILDDSVLSASVTKDGDQFATDVGVFAGYMGPKGGGLEPVQRDVPLVGRATREIEEFGLVQSVFTELLIVDLDSANANAQSRLDSVQPASMRLDATLSPNADLQFKELIPGRRLDCRLSEAVGCIELVDDMRMVSMEVNAEAGAENIAITATRLGQFEDNA